MSGKLLKIKSVLCSIANVILKFDVCKSFMILQAKIHK